MVNYEELIANLEDEKIISLMESLGADRYIEKEGYIIFPTICHNEDADEASMKLYYYKNNHFFYCYTNCNGLSIFKFLQHYYETRQIEYDWYNDIYEVVRNCASSGIEMRFGAQKYKSVRDNYTARKTRKELSTHPQGLMDLFIQYYPPEWLNDGINKESMDLYGIKFSPIQNKIIIPHYNVSNELVGIRGRALNEWEIENVGKYMPVQIEDKWYSHPLSLNLYGLNVSKENIKRYGYCFLYESEKSCMQLNNFSMPNCSAAVCGSNVNKYQIDLLMRTCSPHEIVVCLDKEEENNQEVYFNKLLNMCKKYKNYCNISFIYDIDGLLDLKDSPTDKGEEIFKKLLNKRIKV